MYSKIIIKWMLIRIIWSFSHEFILRSQTSTCRHWYMYKSKHRWAIVKTSYETPEQTCEIRTGVPKKTVKNISHFISSACKRWVRKALRYKRFDLLYLSSDISKSQGKSSNRQVSRSAECSLACNSQLRYGCLGFDKTAFCRECGNVLYTVSLWLHLWLFIEPSTWNWIIKHQDAADWKVVQCLIFLFSYSEINTHCRPNERTFCANLPANAASDLHNISNWKWTRWL